jgi:hypothetical protein
MTFFFFYLLSFAIVGLLIKNAPVVEEELDSSASE